MDKVDKENLEAINAVEIKYDQMIDLFEQCRTNTARCLDYYIDNLEALQEKLNAEKEQLKSDENKQGEDMMMDMDDVNSVVTDPMSYSLSSMILDTFGQLKPMLRNVATTHGRMHSVISNTGKVIDKYFQVDYVGITGKHEPIWDSKENQMCLLNKILQHFAYENEMDILKSLVKEAGLSEFFATPSLYLPPFYDQYLRIRNQLLKGDIAEALEWTELNASKLKLHKQPLEFELKRQLFFQMLKTEEYLDAINFAKDKMAEYADMNNEFSEMMGALAYEDFSQSKYNYYFTDANWQHLLKSFCKAVAIINNCSLSSPLSIVYNVGCSAIPSLLGVTTTLKKTGMEREKWTELPMTIKTDYIFHSVFICPLLRSIVSADNPLMRLSCGHAISKKGIRTIYRRGSVVCPYCKSIVDQQSAVNLYFQEPIKPWKHL